MDPTRFSLEVRPQIPAALSGLSDLADDLLYGWDREVRRLFRMLDNDLYEQCGGNLKVLLRRVAQQRLDAVLADRSFMDAYQRAISAYQAYGQRQPIAELNELATGPGCVAFFCFEFGLHESLPLYSGGLGILAGDYCKAASDLALPVVGVGLLYRVGYFRQQIDAQGEQNAVYVETDFDELPLKRLHDASGAELRIEVPLADDRCRLRLWQVKAGHATLLLLDADIEDNEPAIRSVTHRLYGGDATNRVRQELLLGVGGVRALAAVGIQPRIWHLNEGHAAFGIVERSARLASQGWDLSAALEAVAASTVFTTHTPVAAGHDVFERELVLKELGGYLNERNIDPEWLIALGSSDGSHRLNMTTLAIRGSRYRNGVSRIHGEVAAATERHVWRDISADENPLTFVTNGIHLPTFMALDWVHLFDTRFTGWRSNLTNTEFWSCIDDIPDHRFWSLRQDLKAQLLVEVRRRVTAQHRRNGTAHATTQRVLNRLNSTTDVLVLGFARRFATYKRALLLFNDRERMTKLLSDDERPVLLLMGGKAHPLDEPGRALIREVYNLAMSPALIGRLILVEDYDMALARLMVSGADVWINTPEHPQEASGTSGIKAAMNGSINLSVLDGWWAEAYDGGNGWAVSPHDPELPAEYRNQEESKDLLELLEREVVPDYFARNGSDAWVRRAKASMRTIIPRFNSERMVLDYVRRFYLPAIRRCRLLGESDGAVAHAFSAWKKLVLDVWDGTTIAPIGPLPTVIEHGQVLELMVGVNLNGLSPDDVRVECVVDQVTETEPAVTARFDAMEEADGVWRFAVALEPPFSGLQSYRIRIYPYHELLAHPFEIGRMRWLSVGHP
ncbi:MAG: alpha-glucan family phosphorylase [Pseudomonadales bacterium]